MAPLQRRLENGLGQTVSALLGDSVSELAWELGELPTCFGGLGIRVAQLGFAAQATSCLTVDLYKAVMPNICSALRSWRGILRRLLLWLRMQLPESLLMTKPWCSSSATREKF